MADELQLAFGKPHEEAIAFIQGKPPVTRAVFDRLLPELRARAFTVTGIESFDQLQRIRDSIAGLPAGATWDEAKAEVVGQLDALGDGAERRAELLLRTHAFQAFQAANWHVAQADSDTTHLQYLATEDDRVRDTHRALNGVIVPKDDPFWEKHFPPWEWGCRCRVRPINPDLLEEARQRDAGVAPDDHYVIEGPALERLRQGQLLRQGRAYNVSSPAERPGGDQAFQWSPGDLHLDPAKLAQRYDPEVWSEWKGWADRTEIRPGTSVWDWVQAGHRPSAPAPLPQGPAIPVAVEVVPPAPTGGVPPGLPQVSASLTPTRLGKALRATLTAALTAIDQVHGDGVLPSIPLKASASKAFHGVFRHNSRGAVDIAISRATVHPRLTLAHEVGHFLDLSAIGGAGGFESEKATGLLAKFIEAAMASAGVKAIQEMEHGGMRSYLLRRREIWARAYAQWVAVRSKDPVLLDELAKIRAKFPGRQWEEADFEAIGAAIDQLFRDLKWRT